MMVQAGHGQQRGIGAKFAVHAAVGQDDDVGAVLLDGRRPRQTSSVQRLSSPFAAVADLEQDRQRDRLEAGLVDVRSLANSSLVRIGPLQLDRRQLSGWA
jgi:hypothetical protein